jgi:hypothetical protein
LRQPADHVVEEARARGWDTLRNAELLDAAEPAGFDVFVTTDRNLRFQQHLTSLRIAIVVLGKGKWKLIRLRLPAIAAAVAATQPASFVEIPVD